MKGFILKCIPVILFISIIFNVLLMFNISFLDSIYIFMKSFSAVSFSVYASVIVFCLLRYKSKAVSDIGLVMVLIYLLLLIVDYILLKTIKDFSVYKHITKLLLIDKSIICFIKALYYSGILILLDDNSDSKASGYKNVAILFIFIYEIMLIIDIWKPFSYNSIYSSVYGIIYQLFEVFTVIFIVNRFYYMIVGVDSSFDDNVLDISNGVVNNMSNSTVAVDVDKLSSNSASVVDLDKKDTNNTIQNSPSVNTYGNVATTLNNNQVVPTVNSDINSFEIVKNASQNNGVVSQSNNVQGQPINSGGQDSLFPEYVDTNNSNNNL